MRVDIYRNLNRAKQGLAEQWSIRHKGLVIGYTSAALLKDATTHVQDGAVETIRQSGRKQVCAWFVGEWTPTAVLRTERHRRKDIPIYAEPDGVDYTDHANPVSFNPRHRDIQTARHFFYLLDGSLEARTITPKVDRFTFVYFLATHKVRVIN